MRGIYTKYTTRNVSKLALPSHCKRKEAEKTKTTCTLIWPFGPHDSAVPAEMEMANNFLVQEDDENVIYHYLFTTMQEGAYPLHFAAIARRNLPANLIPNYRTQVIKDKADANAFDKRVGWYGCCSAGESVLHIMCWYSRLDKIEQFLLHSDPDVNIMDSRGRMALYVFGCRDTTRLVVPKMFVDHGVNLVAYERSIQRKEETDLYPVLRQLQTYQSKRRRRFIQCVVLPTPVCLCIWQWCAAVQS